MFMILSEFFAPRGAKRRQTPMFSENLGQSRAKNPPQAGHGSVDRPYNL
jgi:hypothetical protein